MKKKITIIGAGLAGISAGIYLQQKGYNTEIFELAGWCGGMCTAWQRGGYRFDGCIHWMVGTRTGDKINKLYREVDALTQHTEIYNASDIIIEKHGITYILPMEANKFREYLYKLSPEDKEIIDKLCDCIDIMASTNMEAGTPIDFSGKIKFMKESGGFLKLMMKYGRKTVSEFIEGMRSKELHGLLTSLMPAKFSVMALFMMLGTRMGGNAGYPMEGASGVMERMESKYLGLGGKVHLNSKVDEIVVEGGKAVGIKSKGVFYPSDGVIAACDAYDTLQRMLKGKYQHPQLDKMLKESELFDPLVLVSFGLNKKLGIPFSTTYESKDGIKVAPDTYSHYYHIRAFDFDVTAAPDGCSSVMVTIEAPLDYWQKLRKDNLAEYGNQKKRLAAAVAQEVNKRYPGFADAVAVVDVSTPATYVRLTNVHQASFEGFLPTPKALGTNIKKNVKGIKKLFLCGQWTIAGGGICSAIYDGKKVACLMEKTL